MAWYRANFALISYTWYRELTVVAVHRSNAYLFVVMQLGQQRVLPLKAKNQVNWLLQALRAIQQQQQQQKQLSVLVPHLPMVPT